MGKINKLITRKFIYWYYWYGIIEKIFQNMLINLDLKLIIILEVKAGFKKFYLL